MAKIDALKERIKGDRLFWVCSMILVFVFGEMLFFEGRGDVLSLILVILFIASVVSSIYFYLRLQKRIKLLDEV